MWKRLATHFRVPTHQLTTTALSSLMTKEKSNTCREVEKVIGNVWPIFHSLCPPLSCMHWSCPVCNPWELGLSKKKASILNCYQRIESKPDINFTSINAFNVFFFCLFDMHRTSTVALIRTLRKFVWVYDARNSFVIQRYFLSLRRNCPHRFCVNQPMLMCNKNVAFSFTLKFTSSGRLDHKDWLMWKTSFSKNVALHNVLLFNSSHIPLCAQLGLSPF